MAKMFYSIDEAAAKLGMTEQQVRELSASGKLQEFRDRDKLLFKVDQVELLATHDKDDPGHIPLADSGGGSGLSLALEDSSGGAGSSAGIELDEGPKERSGISIFDAESTEEGDPSAVTRITETNTGEALTLESVGSGSGLLDLTREGDDTSLGADLLDDVYKGDDAAGTAGGSETRGESGLFETTSAASDVSSAAGVPMMAMIAAEPYDGTWSGIAGGLALGAIAILLLTFIGTLMALTGVTDNPVVHMVTTNLPMWLGIFAGLLILPAIVGALVGRRT